jgi:hypothetical protein
MFYERLSNIFKMYDLQDLFPEISVDEFADFIIRQTRNGNKLISPYKFAFEQDITVKQCVKFFIYYCGENGIFDILYYFDCSRSGCIGTRIYIDNIDEAANEIIRCEECGKSYQYNTYKNFIKVLFKLKPGISIPKESISIERNDPNSTFEALRELPPHLKQESPSSSVSLDEGDRPEEGVDYTAFKNALNEIVNMRL